MKQTEKKHDEIVDTIKPDKEQKKMEHIMRIIVFLKRWLLKIEQGFCMGTKDKKNIGIKKVVTMLFILWVLWETASAIFSNRTETLQKLSLLDNAYSPFV